MDSTRIRECLNDLRLAAQKVYDDNNPPCICGWADVIPVYKITHRTEDGGYADYNITLPGEAGRIQRLYHGHYFNVVNSTVKALLNGSTRLVEWPCEGTVQECMAPEVETLCARVGVLVKKGGSTWYRWGQLYLVGEGYPSVSSLGTFSFSLKASVILKKRVETELRPTDYASPRQPPIDPGAYGGVFGRRSGWSIK